MKNKLNKQETIINPTLTAEVINYNSNYFGETVYLTHKAEALGDTWYKAKLDYQIGEHDGVEVWFKEIEIEIEAGE